MSVNPHAPYEDASNYYSELCSRCMWGEWRGGCLNPAAAPDGSDGERALQTGSCPVFAAGTPQRDPNPGTLCVMLPLAEVDTLRAQLAEARAELARLRHPEPVELEDCPRCLRPMSPSESDSRDLDEYDGPCWACQSDDADDLGEE